jgi:very-short-patch-repair endonuclease
MTASEWRVWNKLRGRQLNGWKFRRQAPIGPYVVDFVCFAARLVVELDGSSHVENFDYNKRRQSWLESQGFNVLRLSADYPEKDPIEGVWDAIQLALDQIPVTTSPPALRATSPASGEDEPTTSPPALRATSPASGEDKT